MELPKNQEDVLNFVEKGNIIKGILVMPTLYSINANGKYLLWTIHIGILKESIDPGETSQIPLKKSDFIPVEQKYIDKEELPEGFSGAYWTVSGIENMKMKYSFYSQIHRGLNIGKNNYTTPFTQAILQAKSLFDHRIKKGNKLNKKHLKKPGDAYTFEELREDKTRGEHPWRVFAMAVHDYKKFKQKIEYPATLQYKLDGTLFIVVHHPILPEIKVYIEHDFSVNGADGDGEDIYKNMRIDGYSRSRETYENQDHIFKEIYPVALKYPGLHFVGELWKKGYGLQEVSGSSRRKADSKSKTKAVELNFNIFDCFYIDHPEVGFTERQEILDDVFLDLSTIYDEQTNENPKYITRIPTHEVQDEKEMLIIYKKFLKEDLEGGVIRNINALYEFGVNKEMRSYQSLKLKPRPDAEWPVVDFTHGKGKETELVKWICAENDNGVIARSKKNLPLEERKTFNVTPNQPAEIRQYIYNKLSEDRAFFDEYIYGQNLVISYSILSNTFLPQQPKALRFRDEKIEEMLKNNNPV
jgi:hypothetical protein